MRQNPLRLIAITSAIALVAGLGVISFDGTATAVTVRRGDTLWALSRRYGVGVDQLAGANGLRQQDLLPIGLDLAIPSPTRPAPAISASRSKAAASKVSRLKAATSKTPTAKAASSRTAAIGASGAARPQYGAAELAQMRSFCVDYRAPSGSTPLPAALAAHPERLALRPLFVKWSQTYGVSASLIEAIAWQESGWQNDAVSSANAQGIGQLLPTTAAFVSGTLLGLNLKLTVASDNIQMMVRFYAYLLKASGGNQCVAVASYYEGLGAYQRIGVLPQSQVYVKSVFNLRSHFS